AHCRAAPLRTPSHFPYTPLFRSEPAARFVHAPRVRRLVGLAAPRSDLGRAQPVQVETASRREVKPRPRESEAFEDRRDEERASLDRKSTRLNSSHVKTSYAVFCL